MRPSTRELLHGVVDELRRDIVPMAAGDPWLASRLRSVVALLTHVEVRLGCEVEVLEASNEHLGAILAECSRLVPDAVPAPSPVEVGPHGRPPAERLEDLNHDLRVRLEVALRRLHGDGSTAAAEARGLVVAALQADAERERVLFEPFLRMATY